MKKLFTFLLALSFTGAYSQASYQPRTCGTTILPQQFEGWLNNVTPSATSGKYGSANIQSVFNIPVIVHIIHNNENVNSTTATSGNNLNAAQIIDQINILNEDFNGLNADTNLIPTVFKPMLGRMQINFCLAVVNPTGGVLAEPGIDRINRIAKGWSAPPYSTTYADATIKPNSIWDPNRYLNIWVAPLSNGILGYATFPNPGTSGLSGLTGSFGSTSTDGVVILNTSFGSIGTAAFGAYNLGRTATHEIGHWLGLRHIWGDGSCATDYVSDTPIAQTANYGCPSFPYKLGTCTGNTTGEMTMNYMDYTNDACMYMFTNDQKTRAQLILVNSPMRAALITSTVCNLPTIGNDVGITYVARPTYSQAINCFNFIDPILHFTNFGSTTLTSMVIAYNVDGVNTQTVNWIGSVNPSLTFTVALPQITGLGNGTHAFNATVTLPNGGADNNTSNNIDFQNFTITNALNVAVSSATACAGAPTILTASGATNYTWSGGGGNSSTVSVSPNTTTVYTLTANGNNCTVSRTTTVTVTPGPTLTVNSPSVCGGAVATLSASGANSYTWSTGSTVANTTVTAGSSNNFTVSGTAANGCVASKIVTLNILTTPTLVANDVTICAGGTATLSATGAGSYSWSTGSSVASTTVAPGSNAVYTVTGLINTCSSSRTVSVTIGTALSIFINPANPEICVGNSITVSGSGATNYTWSVGGNSNSIILNPSVTTVYNLAGTAGSCPGSKTFTVTVNTLPVTTLTTVNVSCFLGTNGQITAASSGNSPFSYTYSSGATNLPAGNYTVFTTDAKGCASQNIASITQPAPLNSQASSIDTKCPASCDGTIQFTSSGGVGPYSATLIPSNATGQTFTNVCVGIYFYTVKDANGCSATGNVTVTAGNAGVLVTTTITNVSCATCNDATISASGSGGTAPYSYTWMPGNFNTNVVNDVAAGCYTVTVADAQGCSGEMYQCVNFDVGIRSQDLSLQNIKVVPNPTSGKLKIEFEKEADRTIELFDARGRLVIALNASEKSVAVDLNGLSLGIYYARVYSDSTTTVLKIIKE